MSFKKNEAIESKGNQTAKWKRQIIEIQSCLTCEGGWLLALWQEFGSTKVGQGISLEWIESREKRYEWFESNKDWWRIHWYFSFSPLGVHYTVVQSTKAHRWCRLDVEELWITGPIETVCAPDRAEPFHKVRRVSGPLQSEAWATRGDVTSTERSRAFLKLIMNHMNLQKTSQYEKGPVDCSISIAS